MNEITNPHDSFFRETFSRKEIAADFLKSYLPHDIIKRLDINSLTICKDSFIDQELRSHFSDILYQVELVEDDKETKGKNKQNLFLYFLFEHKSSPDKWISLQVLRYMVRIWEQFRKQHPKSPKLPCILPLVLYNGKSQWNIPYDFQSLFGDDKKYFGRYIPDFNYQFYDFSTTSSEQIRCEAIGRVILSLLKHISDPDLLDKLPEDINFLFDILSKETFLELLEIMMRYVVNGTGKYTEDDINKLLNHTVMEDDIMKTFIDKYIEQGMKQGMQQGQYKILSAQLISRFGNLPQWAHEKIENADGNTLEQWSIRLLSAKKLDEVFH